MKKGPDKPSNSKWAMTLFLKKKKEIASFTLFLNKKDQQLVEVAAAEIGRI